MVSFVCHCQIKAELRAILVILRRALSNAIRIQYIGKGAPNSTPDMHIKTYVAESENHTTKFNIITYFGIMW